MRGGFLWCLCYPLQTQPSFIRSIHPAHACMFVCSVQHTHMCTRTHTHTVPQFQLQDSSVYGIEKESTRGKEVLISHQTRGEKHLMNNNEDNNAIMLMIWMRVRGVCVCACVFGSCVYILIPSCWLSWDRVFLIRRAVSRAALLAYQHSLIIFAITRKACRGDTTKVNMTRLQYDVWTVKK